MAAFDDSIVALSSGRPPAAVAIVRSSGPHVAAAAERIAGRLPRPRQASLRRLIDPADGGLIDQALVLRFVAPASSTGEDIVEYQCHGGRATVDALIAALCREPGIRPAEPGEFTRRALINGRIDLTQAEGLADLLAAETEGQRRSAMLRADGVLHRRLEGWRDQLLALSARAEVAIDYSDDVDGAATDDLSPDIGRLTGQIAELLSAPRVEPLRDGVRVVVAGPPNAGKSSIVNVLGQSDRSIVTASPGTTRDIVEVPVTIGGVPMILVDTAGLRETDDEVEAIGVERATHAQAAADILLWLGEAEDRPVHPRLIQLCPKADLATDRPDRVLAVSSVTGEGMRALAELLVRESAKLLPAADLLSIDRRQYDLLTEANAALQRAGRLGDPILIAEELRTARHMIDQIAGRAGVDDLLDALFGRFCLGK